MPPLNKLGTLTPIIYFVNHRDPAHHEGYIMLAPYSQFPTPEGYARHEAGTLPEVDVLQERMQKQSYQEWLQEADRDEAQFRARSEATDEKLRARLVSVDTSEWDKEFIRYYLQVWKPEKRAKHRQRFLERTAYLHVREMDQGDRASDKEEVNLDKLNG